MLSETDGNSEETDSRSQPQPTSIDIPQNGIAKSENMCVSTDANTSETLNDNNLAVDPSSNIKRNNNVPTASSSTTSQNISVTHVPTLTEFVDPRINASIEYAGVDLNSNGTTLPRSVSPQHTNSIPSAAVHQQQLLTHRLVPMPPTVDQSQGYLITVPSHSSLNNREYIGTSLPLAEIKPRRSLRSSAISSSGRRSIHLRLVVDDDSDVLKENEKRGRSHSFGNSFFGPINLPRVIGMDSVDEKPSDALQKDTESPTDLGTIIVSWYEGTTSTELQEHVRNLVCRKLGKQVDDIRLLDEGCIPHEEVVLTPYIPDGTQLIVKFSVRPPTPVKTILRFASPAPDSPSRAPTPCASEADLSVAGKRRGKIPPLPLFPRSKKTKSRQRRKKREGDSDGSNDSGYNSDFATSSSLEDDNDSFDDKETSFDSKEKHPDGKTETFWSNNSSGKRKSRKQMLTKSSSNISDQSRSKQSPKIVYRNATKSEEKKHVVFVLANYFVLFLSLISIFAELHERAPRWMEQLDERTNRVHACAVDSDALYKCVQEGDASGLLASFALWIAKNNKLTKRFFLFGFDSAQQLWTVVYEALVTSFCWGTSYMLIRRGMNPDTRVKFLEKYWKDAIYGSLAGFNAAFMKAVLKNLIPKEVIEDVLDQPNIRILDIFKGFAS